MHDFSAAWRRARTMTTAFVAALTLAAGVQAQAFNCFPPPIDTCGKGAVRGTTDGVGWVAWWVESNFEWRRVHWYFLLDNTAGLPGPIAGSAGNAGAASAAGTTTGAIRSCHAAPHKEALAACRALVEASDRTMPPAILYNVERTASKDGMQPGYRRTAIGALVTDGQRHRRDAWCECWRGTVKLGTTQYCLVTQTESYAACRRVQ